MFIQLALVEFGVEMTHKICLVDDDDGVRGAFRFLLKSHGFSVQDYCSPSDLLAAGDLNSQNCFILDMHMPGMTGLELIDVLRGREIMAPIILITGRPSPEVFARAQAAGVSAFLEKPIEGDHFLVAVKSAVGLPN